MLAQAVPTQEYPPHIPQVEAVFLEGIPELRGSDEVLPIMDPIWYQAGPWEFLQDENDYQIAHQGSVYRLEKEQTTGFQHPIHLVFDIPEIPHMLQDIQTEDHIERLALQGPGA